MLYLYSLQLVHIDHNDFEMRETSLESWLNYSRKNNVIFVTIGDVGDQIRPIYYMLSFFFKGQCTVKL